MRIKRGNDVHNNNQRSHMACTAHVWVSQQGLGKASRQWDELGLRSGRWGRARLIDQICRSTITTTQQGQHKIHCMHNYWPRQTTTKLRIDGVVSKARWWMWKSRSMKTGESRTNEAWRIMIQSNNKSERNDEWECMSIVVNHQRQEQPKQNIKADNSNNKACRNMNGKVQGTWIANKKRNGKNRMIN